MAIRQTILCPPHLTIGIQRLEIRRVSSLGVLVLCVLLLAACGPITARNSPTIAPASTGTTTSSEMVTLMLNHQQYDRGETIVVTIYNGLHSSIYTETAATDCTVVQLERRVGDSWQAQGSCVNDFPHVRIEPIASSVNVSVELLPGGSAGADSGTGSESQWPDGTYRAVFRYATSPQQPLTQGTSVYSASFVVV
jgi:hypothetical protein